MKKDKFLRQRLLIEDCTDTALFLQVLDQNDDSEISWEEIKTVCTSRSSSSVDRIRASIDNFCSNHQGTTQNPKNETNTTITDLECFNNHHQNDESSTSLKTSFRISLDDRLVARAFCDVLVEQRCSLMVTNEENLMLTWPWIWIIVVAGSLLATMILGVTVWVRAVRAKPQRRRAATNDDDDDDNEHNDDTPEEPPNSAAGRSSEVNDFLPQNDEWSSIGSGSSMTESSSCVTGQGIIRTVAQGRIVLDDADRDFVSLKKNLSAEALALQGTESTMYDFDSIDEGDVTAGISNINNASLYFDCIPFPSSSTAL